MLDADAHPGCRAWVPCLSCGNAGCASCAAGRTCDLHWQYLLEPGPVAVPAVPHLYVPLVARYRMWCRGRPPQLQPLADLVTYRGRAA